MKSTVIWCREYEKIWSKDCFFFYSIVNLHKPHEQPLFISFLQISDDDCVSLLLLFTDHVCDLSLIWWRGSHILWRRVNAYKPLCMGFSFILMYLKSGRHSGISRQHSFIHRTMNSSHFNRDVSGRNMAPSGGYLTFSTISMNKKKRN